MKITSKTEEAILIAQARSLLGLNSPINEIAVKCSIIRNALWMDSGAQHPIHTTRIINQTVKFLWNSSSELECREEIKNCLDKLEHAGDLASFSKGKWLPATMREIIIDPDLEESLLVGGVPSNVFPKRIGKKIIHHKQFRKIASGLIDEVYSLPKIALNFWAQIPEEDIELWATKIKSLPLEAFTAGDERQQFQIYIPQSQKHKAIQKFRWKQRFDGISGKYLCRNSTVTGEYYYISELNEGAIVALSNALPRKHYSRMRYAEDFAHSKSVVANAETKNGELIVKLSNRVPLGEHKIFDALGDLNQEVPHLYVWTFDIKYRNVVFHTLQKLKIKIEG